MVDRGRPNAFATVRRLLPAVRFPGGAGALQHRKAGLALAAARLLGGVLGDSARDLAQRIGAQFHTREYARNKPRPFPGEFFWPNSGDDRPRGAPRYRRPGGGRCRRETVGSAAVGSGWRMAKDLVGCFGCLLLSSMGLQFALSKAQKRIYWATPLAEGVAFFCFDYVYFTVLPYSLQYQGRQSSKS